MNAPSFTYDGVDFFALPSQGVFVGVGLWRGKPYLAHCAMNTNGSPEVIHGPDGDVPNVGETTNLDENQQALDEINRLLGTSFPMSAFPGR